MNRDEARIAAPCGADWKGMQPRGRARLCAQCDKLVYDLSSLSERDARALLRRPANESLCIRYLHDTEGNIRFGEEPTERVIPASRLSGGRVAMAAAATALAFGSMLVEACGGASPYDDAYSRTSDAGPGNRVAAPVATAQDAEIVGDGAGLSNAADSNDDGPDTGRDADAGGAADAGQDTSEDAHADERGFP
jgi:hypothetical protein